MSPKKVAFGKCVIFALVLTEVTSWTIDLPEVRRFIFKKNEHEESSKKYEDYKYRNEENPVLYNNIDGNSKHNTKHYDDVYDNTAYAREYGYESYMEKKVNDIVYNGSVYLEGLRRSLENYTRELEDCGRENSTSKSQNRTTWRPAMESSPSNFSSSSNFNSSSSFNSSSFNSSSSSFSNSSRCREVSRTSEHVRRLSELAMWATRELQDIAYARKYKKDDEHSLSMQENELILKLAWFLDRLAHYTGYEPRPGEFLRRDDGTTTSTTTPAPVSLVSPSPEVKRQMMECLKQNSSENAVDRCRYPEPLPPLVQMMMEMNSNISGIPAMPAPSASNLNQQVVPIARNDPVSEQSMELHIASDYRTPSSNLPSLTALRSVKKRSVLSIFGPKVEPEKVQEKLEYASKYKRSAEVGVSPTSLVENDSTINFLKYYVKHKVWEGANSKKFDSKTFQTYEVKNDLTHKILKRAIDNKKFKHLKLPENPFQDLGKYIKHKPGVNYVKDEILAEKIKAALEKMNGKSASKTLLRKLTKMYRQKRSIKYEKDVDLPRESGDPQKDISFYVKNKPGRNYNNDLLQAVQVRAGLEQVFSTGDIEVVRRFGANYNPLIPDPFMAGIMKSQADFKK